MAKIKIDDSLLDRAKRIAQIGGYPSVEEFIAHVLEKEISRLDTAESDEQVTERLRGLGYLE